ncbi:hypothetical protein [Lactococcus kimchii]|uniref:hypothetical protein n=1 Tax=Lactococcus sp. S-13 TaxID=2507158 RepID=UPI0010235AB0|nr:hypothetical protein [Lactococcus sp. S-13]RZI49643.1 hypothetical protein EQJ87_09515 [Lactococcus sp. S-13]
MSNPKKLVLVGIIISAIKLIVELIKNSIGAWTSMKIANWSDFFAFAIAFIMAVSVVSLPTFVALQAFRKIEGNHAKIWWKIILIIGILALLWAIICLLSLNILGGIIFLIEGAAFVMAFVLNKNQKAVKNFS